MSLHRRALAVWPLLALSACHSRASRVEPDAAHEFEGAEGTAFEASDGRLTRPAAPTRGTTAATEEVDAVIAPGFENAMIETSEERVSSFGLDASTASYAAARAALSRGEFPDPLALRTEDFINRFEYRYAAPAQRDFAFHVEAVPSPYRDDYHMLRLGIRARDSDISQRDPAFLVFVVDVSNSMDKNGHLAMLQDGLRALAQRLGPKDVLTLVTYGHRGNVVLEPTAGDERAAVLTAIDQLRPEGASNLDAGLALAAEIAATYPEVPKRRLIVCSDGFANAGVPVTEQLMTRVANIARQGVAVSTIGLGLGNYGDPLMEQLSAAGRGLHAYVDRREEVRRVLAENLAGTPQVVAHYAKVEVEFAPQHIARFRRLGYERGRPAFDDLGTQDEGAGKIGAGHSVTALYEIQLQPNLRFGGQRDASLPLGVVRLRYHDTSDRIRVLEYPFVLGVVRARDEPADPKTELAVIAAMFAENLRHSYWARDAGWSALVEHWTQIPPAAKRWRDVAELGELILAAAELSSASGPGKGKPQLMFERLPVLK